MPRLPVSPAKSNAAATTPAMTAAAAIAGRRDVDAAALVVAPGPLTSAINSGTTSSLFIPWSCGPLPCGLAKNGDYRRYGLGRISRC
jgi:hypothetical protein